MTNDKACINTDASVYTSLNTYNDKIKTAWTIVAYQDYYPYYQRIYFMSQQ